MNKQEQLDTLQDIRNIMHRSSRFISLSGLSGVFAGITALVGAYFAKKYLDAYFNGGYGVNSDINIEFNLLIISAIVLAVALFGGVFFTYRQGRKKNLPIWDKTTKNLLINLFIPLLAGGVFIIALLLNHSSAVALIAPSTLIFYGLALVNASKYTYSDIRFLGLCEVFLGCVAIFYAGYGLYFWAFGFGVLHIFYGLIMYFKYEKSEKA